MDTVKFQSDILSCFQGYIFSCIDFGNFIPISYFPVLIVCIGIIHNIAGCFCFFSINSKFTEFHPYGYLLVIYNFDITCRSTFQIFDVFIRTACGTGMNFLLRPVGTIHRIFIVIFYPFVTVVGTDNCSHFIDIFCFTKIHLDIITYNRSIFCAGTWIYPDIGGITSICQIGQWIASGTVQCPSARIADGSGIFVICCFVVASFFKCITGNLTDDQPAVSVVVAVLPAESFDLFCFCKLQSDICGRTGCRLCFKCCPGTAVCRIFHNTVWNIIIFVTAACQCDRHFFNRCHLIKEQSYIVTSLLVGLDLEVGI